MTAIALIPARAGSKRVPGKNFREMCGLALWRWTAKAALRADCFDRVVLATDHEPTLCLSGPARQLMETLEPPGLQGVFTVNVFQRKPADDMQQIEHLVGEWIWETQPEWKRIVILQPTSPTRTAQDIKTTVARWKLSKADTVVSVSSRGHGWDGFTNGSIYGCTREYWERTGHFLGGKMMVRDVGDGIDVDTEEDWQDAEKILRRRHGL